MPVEDNRSVGRVPMHDVSRPENGGQPETLFTLTQGAQHVDITGGSFTEQNAALHWVLHRRITGGRRGRVLVVDFGSSNITQSLIKAGNKVGQFPLSSDVSHGEMLDFLPSEKRAEVLADAIGGTSDENLQRRGILAKIGNVFLEHPYPETYEDNRLSAVEQFIQAIQYLRQSNAVGLTREQREALQEVITDDERTTGLGTKVLFDLNNWFQTLTKGKEVQDDLFDVAGSLSGLVVMNVNHPREAGGRIVAAGLDSLLGGEYGTVAIVGVDHLSVEEVAKFRQKAVSNDTRTQTVYLYTGANRSDEMYAQIGTDTHVILGEGNAVNAKKISDLVIGTKPMEVGGYTVSAGSAGSTTYAGGLSDHFQLTPHPVGSGDSRTSGENQTVSGGVTADRRIDFGAHKIHPDGLQQLLNMAVVTDRAKRSRVVPLFPGAGVTERGLPEPVQLVSPDEVIAGHDRGRSQLSTRQVKYDQRVAEGRAPRPELDPSQRAQELRMRCGSVRVALEIAKERGWDKSDPELWDALRQLR